jgi:hypothetical protein
MKFHRDNTRARSEQLSGDDADTGADVEYQFTRLDARVCDELGCPRVSEPVPAPLAARPRGGGHG